MAPRRGSRRPDMGKLGMYIARTVLGYTLLVMLVLLALGALFMFIGQQDDIGTGSYTRDAGVAVRRVEPAELPVRVAARRRVDRCVARPRQPRPRQRVDRDARIGRDDGTLLPLAGGGRPRACARDVRGRRIRGAAARAVCAAVEGVQQVQRIQPGRQYAAPGCATATRSSAWTSNRRARASAASRCFSWISQRRLRRRSGVPSRPALASDRVWRLEDYAETEFADGGTRAATQGHDRIDHEPVAGISRPGGRSNPNRWAWPTCAPTSPTCNATS